MVIKDTALHKLGLAVTKASEYFLRDTRSVDMMLLIQRVVGNRSDIVKPRGDSNNLDIRTVPFGEKNRVVDHRQNVIITSHAEKIALAFAAPPDIIPNKPNNVRAFY